MSVVGNILLLVGLSLIQISARANKDSVTFVTALYDLGRGNFHHKPRTFEGFYLKEFAKLLKIKANLVVFGEAPLRDFVAQHRNPNETMFIEYSIQDIMDWHWFAKKGDRIMKEITAGSDRRAVIYKSQLMYQLPMYLQVTNCKMLWMAEVEKINPFDSSSIYWLDAGITHVMSPGRFDHRNHFESFQTWANLPLAFEKVTWHSDHLGYEELRVKFTNYSIPITDDLMAGFFGGKAGSFQTISNVL